MIDVCWIGSSKDAFAQPTIQWLLDNFDRVLLRHSAADVIDRIDADPSSRVATLGVYSERFSGTDSALPTMLNDLRGRFEKLVHVRGPLANGFQRHPVQPSVTHHQFKDWVRQFRDEHADERGKNEVDPKHSGGWSIKPSGQVLLRTHDRSAAEIWLDNFASHGRAALWSPTRGDIGNRIDEVWWDQTVAEPKRVRWCQTLSPYDTSVRHVWIAPLATEDDIAQATRLGVSRVIERPQWCDFTNDSMWANGRSVAGSSGSVFAAKRSVAETFDIPSKDSTKPAWRRVA